MDRDFNVESERREIGQRLREDLVREAARDRHQPEPLGARARLKLRQPRHYPRPHGWNTRKANFGKPDLCDLTGQYVPFAVHAGDRKSDPRPSVEERYGSKAGYMARVREAVEDQEEEGLLLPDDAATILQ